MRGAEEEKEKDDDDDEDAERETHHDRHEDEGAGGTERAQQPWSDPARAFRALETMVRPASSAKTSADRPSRGAMLLRTEPSWFLVFETPALNGYVAPWAQQEKERLDDARHHRAAAVRHGTASRNRRGGVVMIQAELLPAARNFEGASSLPVAVPPRCVPSRPAVCGRANSALCAHYYGRSMPLPLLLLAPGDASRHYPRAMGDVNLDALVQGPPRHTSVLVKGETSNRISCGCWWWEWGRPEGQNLVTGSH